MATLPMRTDCALSGEVLAEWTGGRWIGTPPDALRGVCLDSRAVVPGDLFVALPGTSSDGHAFIDDAKNRGAGAAVVCHANGPPRLPLLVVGDTLGALRTMAARRREEYGGTVIALTGSVGKTTVKDMTAAILAEVAPTAATRGNFNNATGVPLTLLALDTIRTFAVVEIGMSFPGEIRSLVRLVKPHIGAVLNVRPVHLENFPDIRGIAAAKGEILAGIEPGGTAVLNIDEPLVRALPLPEGIMRVWFGEDASADLRLEANARVDMDRQSFSIQWHGLVIPVSLAAPGAHNRLNAAAGAAIALAAGARAEHVTAGLAKFAPSPMRSRLVRLVDGSLLMEDCYNASPDAVRAALRTIAELPVNGRRVVVLGDMRELGSSAEEFHRRVGDEVASLGISSFLAFGPLSARAVDEYRRHMSAGRGAHFDAVEDLIARLIDDHRAGDIILVKGSRAMRMERVTSALLARFPATEPPGRPPR